MNGIGSLFGFMCMVIVPMMLGWVIGQDRATRLWEWMFKRKDKDD